MPTTISDKVREVSVRFALSDFRAEMLQDSLDSLPQPAINPDRNSIGMEAYLAIEEVMGALGVFKNGMTGRPCSMASYGTLLDFESIKVALALVGVERFTRAEWVRMVGYYRFNWNLSPIIGLYAAQLARFAGLPDPLQRTPETEDFYRAA